jgi:glycosyltransferase involved in cell wall biosynthesis
MKAAQIHYVRWERDDAIGKVTLHLLNGLKNNNIDVKLINLTTISKGKLVRLFNFPLLVHLFKGSDIVHFEEPRQIELLANLLLNKYSLLTVHHVENRKHRIDLHFFIVKLVHRSFSKLIAISEKTKRDLIDTYRINPDKIVVAHLGVDKNIFMPTTNRIGFLKDKRYVLYLGSEIPRKNIVNLLRAFKEISQKYPDLYLVKAGYSGGEVYREETKKLIKSLELTSKVILVSERIKEIELPQYYSNAEMFVYPTLQEGFGIPLVEAMSCGCPIVTSNIDPMKEIAKDQQLVNPSDYQEISSAMDEILSNQAFKEELSKKAIKRAENYDWREFLNKVCRAYQEFGKRA